MKPYKQPTILTDLIRLNEIFKLRCLAWENSPFPNYINFTKYPNGFQDTLDKDSIHFYSTNHSDEIIAAARLSIVNKLEDLPSSKIFTLFDIWPNERPFLFYSRLVIHPDYRNQGLMKKFDYIRIKFQLDNLIPFAIATANKERLESLRTYGWEVLNEIPNDIEEDYPFKKTNHLLLQLKDIKL